MTPGERAALEAVAQRPLSLAELEQIDALLPGRRDDLIAALLSEGRTRVVSHFASERGILDRYPGGLVAADTLLSKIEAFAQTPHPMAGIVKRAVRFLGQNEGIDLGSSGVLMMLVLLVEGEVITQTEADGLRAMATEPDPIATNTVSDALNRAQALMTLEG